MSVYETLLAALADFRKSRVTILAIGNRLKGDDAAGPLVCDKLANRTSAALIDSGSVPENYIGPVRTSEPELLLIIDAVELGCPPGTVKILDPESLSRFTSSTHAPSPRLFIDLLRADLPVTALLIAVQPVETGLGTSLTPAVQTAVNELADALAIIFPKNTH